jgi:hypothetical protein
MSRRSKFSRHENQEISWISMTDVFVVGCCIFVILAFVAQASKKQSQSDLISISASSPKAANEAISGKTEKELLAIIDGTKSQLRDTQKRLDEARSRYALENRAILDEQKRINNKLVGLGGRLENVVFMVDVSKSMRNNKGKNGVVTNNWIPAVQTIERWINGLDVKAACLIVFGENAEVKVPMQILESGGREKILSALGQLTPNSDSTNFLDAFEKAYQIQNLDTIIVFSDGLPSIDINGRQIEVEPKKANESDKDYSRRREAMIENNIVRVLQVHKAISEMAQKHSDVAINVIGLGAGVYSEKTGNLLNDLALDNGGIFLALPSKVADD